MTQNTSVLPTPRLSHMFSLENPRLDDQSSGIYDLLINGRSVMTGVPYDTAMTYCLENMADDDLYREPHMPAPLTGRQLKDNHNEMELASTRDGHRAPKLY